MTLSPQVDNIQTIRRLEALKIYDSMMAHDGSAQALAGSSSDLQAWVALLVEPPIGCDDVATAALRGQTRFKLASQVVPQLRAEESDRLWQLLGDAPCATAGRPQDQQWSALFAAYGRRDGASLYRLASGLLDGAAQSLTEPYYAYLVASAMLGALAQNDAAAAMKVWESYGVRRWPPDPINLYLRLLLQTTRQRVAGLVVAAP